MIDFRRPQLSDRDWVEPIFRASGFRSCEYTFTNLLTWADVFQETIAPVQGFAAVRVGKDSFSWPAGSGDRKALLRTLAQDTRERGENRFQLWGLVPEQCSELETLFPDCFRFTHDADADDYCYEIERLATLSGKKLHAKRNHIHRFEESYPHWRVEKITPENLPLCLELDRAWENREQEAGLDDRNEENGENALRLSMRHYEALGLEGLILYGEEEPLAFTAGQLISGDTYDVIFEKAYGEVQGAYPMINREFARYVREHYPEVRYLNREDDMGEPNLRKAKQSYHPDLMIEKWSAELKEGASL